MHFHDLSSATSLNLSENILKCLLCLEMNEDVEDGWIQVNSKQWQELDVAKLIEKHLWAIDGLRSQSWLCSKCWKELDDFHQFYIRVKGVHDVLSSLVVVKTEDCTDDPLEENIKIEIPNERSISVEKDTIELDEGMQIKQDPEEVNDENDHDINDSDENNTDDSASSDSDDHDDLSLLQPINKDFTGKMKIKQRKNYYPSKMSRTQYPDFIKEHFPITCNKCNQHLDSFSALIDHFKAAHNDERAYVLCCDTKIFKIGLLVDHINYHKNPEYFKCIHCDKVFPLRRQLLTHLKSHEGLKHSCDICGRKFLNKSKLGLHKITHMSQEEKMSNVEMKHHCTICDKRFLSKTNLDRHKIRHLSKEEKKFPCQECGKLFGNEYVLNQHHRVVHLGVYAKICEICGQTMPDTSTFKHHMEKHQIEKQSTTVTSNPFECDECGLLLSSHVLLKRHKDLKHPIGGSRDYTCHICNKISPTMRALKKHIKCAHEMGYDYKCTLCEKAFKRSDNLKAHMSTHTGTKLYRCSWCPKEFNSNGNMYMHRKKAHPEEWEEERRKKYSGNFPPNLKRTDTTGS